MVACAKRWQQTFLFRALLRRKRTLQSFPVLSYGHDLIHPKTTSWGHVLLNRPHQSTFQAHDWGPLFSISMEQVSNKSGHRFDDFFYDSAIDLIRSGSLWKRTVQQFHWVKPLKAACVIWLVFENRPSGSKRQQTNQHWNAFSLPGPQPGYPSGIT